MDRTTIERKLSVPNAERMFWLAVAMRGTRRRRLGFANDRLCEPGVRPVNRAKRHPGRMPWVTRRQDARVTSSERRT